MLWTKGTLPIFGSASLKRARFLLSCFAMFFPMYPAHKKTPRLQSEALKKYP